MLYIWHEFWKIQYLLQQSKICSTKTTKRVLLITFACSLLRKSRKTCRLWDRKIRYITGTLVLNEWAWTDNLQCVEAGADVVVSTFTQCQQCVEVCFQLFLSHHLTTHITIIINVSVIITTKLVNTKISFHQLCFFSDPWKTDEICKSHLKSVCMWVHNCMHVGQYINLHINIYKEKYATVDCNSALTLLL